MENQNNCKDNGLDSERSSIESSENAYFSALESPNESSDSEESFYDTETSPTTQIAAEHELSVIAGEVCKDDEEMELSTVSNIAASEPIIEYKCTKSCATGHAGVYHPCSAPNHDPDEPCPPCQKTLKIVQLDCGHSWLVRCGNRLIGKPLCQKPCKKFSSCGHQCQKLCYEECAPCKLWTCRMYADCHHFKWIPCEADGTELDQCTALTVSALNCPGKGHGKVNAPCQVDKWSVRYNEPEILRPYCESKCNMEYAREDNGCGQGICKNDDCHKGRLHQRCKEQCGKIQVCGHKCELPCSDGCGPCPKECSFNCPHGKCALKCGRPCKKCMEPCTYKCHHFACTKLCSEPCNKPPCKFPCRKKLHCGHPCIGFCGEICPAQCRICNVEELIPGLLMTADEIGPSDKFIHLENCGHAIQSDLMDCWMNAFPKNNEVVLKQCPLCRHPIYYLPRYSNILWELHQDFNTVKTNIFGTRGEVEQIENEIDEILELLNKIPNFKHFRSTGIYLCNACINSDWSNKSEIGSFLGFTKFWANVTLMFEMDESPVPKLPKKIRQKLIEEYEILFTLMTSRKLPFGKTEIGDFNKRIKRLEDYLKFLKFCHTDKETGAMIEGIPLAKKGYQQICELLTRSGPYTTELKDEFEIMFKDIKKWTGKDLGPSSEPEPQRISILEPIGSTTGRGFKCPNGHVNLVTECGGVMGESKCDECGEMIDGNNHRVRNGNLWEPKLDGGSGSINPDGEIEEESDQ